MEEEIIRQFGTEFQNIEEIGSVIIGQKDLIRGVLTAMIAGGNVLLEGLPGLGKTQLVKTIVPYSVYTRSDAGGCDGYFSYDEECGWRLRHGI